VNHPQIAAFARLARENEPPVRSIEGQKTLISRTMHGMAYDSARDEIVVTSPLAQTILVFRGSADGEEAPLRVIHGPKTQILGTGLNGNDKISIDEVHGEYYIPILDGVAVFDRDSNGDTAPKRILKGPDTRIKGITAAAADPVHDRLVVRSDGALLIFERTARGNVKPLSTIEGNRVGVGGLPHQLRVYGPKGWILDGARGGSLGVWSVNDSGNIPPRWRIPVRQLADKGEGASGIDLDPVHKELWVTSGSGNRFMTFYFPEIF
jgi:hypothetical protein